MKMFLIQENMFFFVLMKTTSLLIKMKITSILNYKFTVIKYLIIYFKDPVNLIEL